MLFGNLSRFGDGPSRTPFLEQIHSNIVSLLLHLNDLDPEVRKVCIPFHNCSFVFRSILIFSNCFCSFFCLLPWYIISNMTKLAVFRGRSVVLSFSFFLCLLSVILRPFLFVYARTSWVQSLEVQYSSRWYLCAWKSPYALYLIFERFPQSCLWNSSFVHQIDAGNVSVYDSGRFSDICI